MNVLILIAWLWLISGVFDMVLTSPNLFITWIRVRYWRKVDGSDDAPLVIQWGNLRLHIVLFVLGLLFFVLGLIGILRPAQSSVWVVLSFAALTVLPVLGSVLALMIASDERYVATRGKG